MESLVEPPGEIHPLIAGHSSHVTQSGQSELTFGLPRAVREPNPFYYRQRTDNVEHK